MKLVRGVGICDKGKYPTKIGRRNTKEYELWNKMLQRCYSGEFHKFRPSYVGCSVSENFKSFQFFAEWCNKQIGFKNKGWHLDKDILLRGNKVYSEDNCVFVPHEVNTAFLSCTVNRGEYPVGSSLHKKTGKLSVKVRLGNRSEYLGLFSTREGAFLAYKQAKESYIVELANKFINDVDRRVYEALINWRVRIDD